MSGWREDVDAAIAGLYRVPPHMLGTEPTLDDPRELQLAYCQAGGWPLTPGAAELVAERHVAAIHSAAAACDRYLAVRAAERAAWSWWRRLIWWLIGR